MTEEEDMLEINDANSLTSKGIQTMLRLTSENHLKLSDMADHKANILISVNAIIISVILGVLMRKLEEEPALTIPTIIFLVSCCNNNCNCNSCNTPKSFRRNIYRPGCD